MLQNQMIKNGVGCLIRASLALCVPQAHETATQAPKTIPHATLHAARNEHRAQTGFTLRSSSESSETRMFSQ